MGERVGLRQGFVNRYTAQGYGPVFAKIKADGAMDGIRSTRLSAAQRRVVAAAERWYREGYNVKTWDAFGDALEALERAKGDRK